MKKKTAEIVYEEKTAEIVCEELPESAPIKRESPQN
jgi:hypothetical protein